jgi:hypothetical protein
MKLIKNTSIALALALMLSASGAAHAQGAVIYERQNQEVLAKGIVYKNIYRFTEGGIVNINLIEANVKDSDVDFDVLYNKNGFSSRAKLSTMVSQSPDVIAAVNGDFFSMSNPSFSLGAIVKDGKLLSNPHYEEQKYASILVDGSRNVVFDYISPNVKAQNVARGVDVPVAAVNKPSQYFANIVAYTKEYSAKSPGAHKTLTTTCARWWLTRERYRRKIRPAGRRHPRERLRAVRRRQQRNNPQGQLRGGRPGVARYQHNAQLRRHRNRNGSGKRAP